MLLFRYLSALIELHTELRDALILLCEHGFSSTSLPSTSNQDVSPPPALVGAGDVLSDKIGSDFLSQLVHSFVPKLRALYLCYAQDWASLGDHTLRVLESDPRGEALLAGPR